MTLRPCLVCGEPASRSRCDDHRPKNTKASATARGYDRTWRKLSERARRLAPFCEDCGAIEDLQTDHSPEAWRRKAEGKPIRLRDVSVVCGTCNRRRGAARPTGDTPSATKQRPTGKAKFESHTARLA